MSLPQCNFSLIQPHNVHYNDMRMTNYTNWAMTSFSDFQRHLERPICAFPTGELATLGSALQTYSGDRTGSTSTDRDRCDAQSHQTPNRYNFLTADNDEKCHIAILNARSCPSVLGRTHLWFWWDFGDDGGQRSRLGETEVRRAS